MRRIIAVVAAAVLGGGCGATQRAEAGCRLRFVTYNVAKLNSENPDCVPGSWTRVQRKSRSTLHRGVPDPIDLIDSRRASDRLGA